MHHISCKRKHFLISIILGTILLSLPSCWYFREKGLFGKKALREALIWARQDSIRVADSLNKIGITLEFANKIKQDSELMYDRDKIAASEVVPKSIYYLIIGSFINHENAKLAANHYRNQGYETNIISITNLNGKRVELVSVKTFKDEDEADRYLKEFKSNIDSKAWIYKKR